ncbi:MAG: hypothetical protein GY952_05525 [Rhodobacteraceae bacterium]|nr:hypothetical protein [Paracoccaceae bacterium]
MAFSKSMSGSAERSLKRCKGDTKCATEVIRKTFGYMRKQGGYDDLRRKMVPIRKNWDKCKSKCTPEQIELIINAVNEARDFAENHRRKEIQEFSKLFKPQYFKPQ